jgi:transcriptional regulator with XRE-family HTH domain
MKELEDLERAAGLDPAGAEYRLRQALAEADDDLLERLVRVRKEKGLTQQDVADRMLRDKSAVSNFERLSADPHLSTIRRYAAAVGAMISHSVVDFDSIGIGSDVGNSVCAQEVSKPDNVISMPGGIGVSVATGSVATSGAGHSDENQTVRLQVTELSVAV